MRQSGGILGPDGAITHYTIEGVPGDAVITFGSQERPGASPMYLSDLLREAHHPYHIAEPEGGWRQRETFSPEEKQKLRPIAETLAMLDANAFFGTDTRDGIEWYEWYLPEAFALYEANGGDHGSAGASSMGPKQGG